MLPDEVFGPTVSTGSFCLNNCREGKKSNFLQWGTGPKSDEITLSAFSLPPIGGVPKLLVKTALEIVEGIIYVSE